MPLAFLAPVFLAGLAALAIPVLIHLADRPKREVVRFPSLMFLEATEYRASSRRRLRDVLLFLLRALAIVLFVAAFARPFVDRADAVPAGPDGGREVVVLLDRSASMAAGDRLARARAAVEEVAAGLRRGDRATLVAFDREAAALHRATDDPAVLRRAAAGVEVGAGGTRYTPALRLAESILVGTPLPRRELVLVTDFQRSGWSADEAPRMPRGAEVRVVDVGAPPGNRFVADVAFARERFAGRDRVEVTATVARRPGEAGGQGAGAPGEADVVLELDGRRVASRRVALPADGAARVAFDPVTLPDGPARGVVRLEADELPGDDAFHFVLSGTRPLRAVLGADRGDGPPYLDRALAVAPELERAVLRADRVGDALAGVDVVVLEGQPGGDALARLGPWVRAGGGLVVALGPDTRGRTWAEAGLLPGEVGRTREAAEDGAGLTDLATDHPALRPFRAAPAGLAGTRIYRYRELAPAAGARVLARLDGGAAAVVAAEAGRGRVVALTTPLDGRWNDLVLQPGFVPLVHGLVRWAAGREPAPEWRRVGDLLEARPLLAGPVSGAEGEAAAGDGARPVLLTPGDEARAVHPDSLYPLTERGFYELRDPRSAAGAVVVAVNGDPAESEPARVDPEAVRSALTSTAPVVVASFGAEDHERRQSLWWYFLAAAFVVLAAETVLGNTLSRNVVPRTGEGS